MPNQPHFDFVLQIDKEQAEKRKREALEHKRSIQDSWLHSAVEDLPPHSEEWDIILMGIRLSRHMHDSEYQRCKLGCYNHCPDELGSYWSALNKQYIPIKVCIKDYFQWCDRHGWKVRITTSHYTIEKKGEICKSVT